jgi:6-pyruvoyltetrahydropterin/6-carboxytetrahydropterin synthase
MDYFDLRKITEEVLSSLDHRYLNEIISYPTCENIAMYIKNGVAERLKEAKLISVRIWEGEDQWVEG